MNNALNTSDLPRFGIEIETVGISRSALAAAIQSVVQGRLDSYSCTVTDSTGRVWNVVRDASLTDAEYRSGEVVSPILTYADLDLLQNIVRALRAAGARVDGSTGIHIHVDGARFDGRTLLNLVNMVHKQERIIERALAVRGDRLTRYCKSIDHNFVERIDALKGRTVAELQAAWYGGATPHGRYDMTRYHGLNLNSFFYRGTIEFRYFNGTLHAGEVKAYVQFVLAMAAKALNSKSTSRARRVIEPQNEKWAFRVFLKNLGLIGDEFKTLRLHLTKNLEGKSNRTRPVASA